MFTVCFEQIFDLGEEWDGTHSARLIENFCEVRSKRSNECTAPVGRDEFHLLRKLVHSTKTSLETAQCLLCRIKIYFVSTQLILRITHTVAIDKVMLPQLAQPPSKTHPPACTIFKIWMFF